MKKIILAFCLIVLYSQIVYADIPTNVTISVIDDDIHLSWSDTNDSDIFYIYRSAFPDSGFVKIDSTPDTSYTDIGIGNEIRYFYYITASKIVTDIDGNVYQTVQIGDQLWMAENLKVTHYRNGDPIPHVTDNGDWCNLSTGAYCVYNNDPVNADTYGNLYNWFAVGDSRNIAPEGWHVPTDEEIMELEMALGMSQEEAHSGGYRGTNEGSKLAGRADLWSDGALKDNAEFGTSGFSALPSGYRAYVIGNFHNIGNHSYFFSSTEAISNSVRYRELTYLRTTIYRINGDKRVGFSVRCVKD